jgi:hypothetical protein
VVNFENKIEALTEIVSVPNWFSVDTKTGVCSRSSFSLFCFSVYPLFPFLFLLLFLKRNMQSLTVHLDCPQCFSAEVYAGDVFDDLPPGDEEVQSMSFSSSSLFVIISSSLCNISTPLSVISSSSLITFFSSELGRECIACSF